MENKPKLWSEECRERNRAAIRAIMQERLGITQKEICNALGLARVTVGRHFREIRAEWRRAEKAQAR